MFVDKRYYSVTVTMTFQKTVLVPIEFAKDIDEAIEIVDAAVDSCEVLILNEDADYEIGKASTICNDDGIYEISEEYAKYYQVLEGNK